MSKNIFLSQSTCNVSQSKEMSKENISSSLDPRNKSARLCQTLPNTLASAPSNYRILEVVQIFLLHKLNLMGPDILIGKNKGRISVEAEQAKGVAPLDECSDSI